MMIMPSKSFTMPTEKMEQMRNMRNETVGLRQNSIYDSEVESVMQLMVEYVETNPLAAMEEDFEEQIKESIRHLVFTGLVPFLGGSMCQTKGGGGGGGMEIGGGGVDDLEDTISNDSGVVEPIIRDAYFFFCCYFMPRRSFDKTIIFQEPNVEYVTQRLQELRDKPHFPQRSFEWFLFRYNLISASDVGKIFGTPAAKNRLIFDKCQPPPVDEQKKGEGMECEGEENDAETEAQDAGEIRQISLQSSSSLLSSRSFNRNSSLHWGQKYESLSVKLYEHIFSTKIGEFGILQHDEYAFLGASPDGINVDPTSSRYGRLLEIKNVKSREIDGVPKKEYWIQMQVQMEVCNFDECDFLETQFYEFESEELYQAYDFSCSPLLFTERFHQEKEKIRKSFLHQDIHNDIETMEQEDDEENEQKDEEDENESKEYISTPSGGTFELSESPEEEGCSKMSPSLFHFSNSNSTFSSSFVKSTKEEEKNETFRLFSDFQQAENENFEVEEQDADDDESEEEDEIEDDLFTCPYHFKGMVLFFVSPTGEPKYIFKPFAIEGMECEHMWMENVVTEMVTHHEYTFCEVQYWLLEVFSCVLVLRNKFWMQNALPYIQETWKQVLHDRQYGCEHRAPKSRKRNPPSESYVSPFAYQPFGKSCF